MKPRSPLQNALLSSSLLILTAHVANAADLFWDGADTGADAQGGTGTWDNGTTSNWDDAATGGADSVWTNANNDTAIFGGASGTVTLGDDIDVAGMKFTTAGYVVEGGGNKIIIGNNGGVRNTSVPMASLWTTSGTTTINADIDTNGFRFTTIADGGSSAIFNGVISGSGGFASYTSSNITLTGANTYTGKTLVTSDTTSGSTLSVSSFNSVNGGTPLMSSSSLGAPTTIANGTIDLGNSGKRATCTLIYEGAAATGETSDRVININFNGSDSQILNASGSGLLKFTSAMTTNANSGHTGAFILRGTGTGEIVELPTLANTGGLRKLDDGTWTLGQGTVSQLTVEGGKLLVNGVLSVSTTVTVNSGTTLGGSGTVGGDITVNNGGTLSAGNSAGKFTVGGTLTLGATSNTLMELGGTTLGSTFDNITLDDLATAMTYGGNLDVVNLGIYDMDASSFTYDLFDLKGVTATGDFATVTVNSILLSNSLGVWTGSNGGVNYSFSQATGDLNISAVPEPATALLGAIGILALLRRRR